MTLTKFVRTGAAAIGALAVISSANAADIYSGGGGLKDVPVAPPPVWTGFYAGIHLGAAWTDFGKNNNYFCDDYCANNVVNSWGYNTNETRFNLKGDNNAEAFGGGQFGYNWQPYGWNNFVVGLEVDIDGLGGNNNRTAFPNTYDSAGNLTTINAVTLQTNGGFAGDVTGRIGYTWGPAMIYAKGGFAWLDAQFKLRATSCDVSVTPVSCATFNGANGSNYGNWSNDNTLTGWTVGAGVEWLLNPNWSVKIEYLYYDFANNNNNWGPNMYNSYANGSYMNNNYNNWRFNNDVTVNTVKLGLNYHLTNNYVPLK